MPTAEQPDHGQVSTVCGRWSDWKLGGNTPLGGGIACLMPYCKEQPDSLGDYFKCSFMSGGQADHHNFPQSPFGAFGGSPTVAKNQVNTNAAGGRPSAKSLFRNLSKGQKVKLGESRDGSIRRYTEDGSAQIRMKSS